MSTMLVNAGLTTFQQIEETNPREIELVTTIITIRTNSNNCTLTLYTKIGKGLLYIVKNNFILGRNLT